MRARILLVCLLAPAVLGACGNLFEPAAAVVGGRKITVGEVDEVLDILKRSADYEQLSAQGNIEAIQRQAQQAYLGDLIRLAVLDIESKELGISVSDEEVAEEVARAKEELGAEGLKEQGLTDELLELRIRFNLIQGKLHEEVTSDIQPTEAEIEEFYEQNIADYTRARIHHILVKEFAVAKQIASDLQNVPEKQLDERFAQAARANSIDQRSARRGGDLGVVGPGELDDRFESKAAQLDVGEVSDPVQTQFGYHIIRVVDRDVTPLDEVSDAIARQLAAGDQDEVWQEYLREAYEDADIKINSRFGELDLETLTIVDATAEDIPGAVRPTQSPSPALTP